MSVTINIAKSRLVKEEQKLNGRIQGLRQDERIKYLDWTFTKGLVFESNEHLGSNADAPEIPKPRNPKPIYTTKAFLFTPGDAH